MNLTKRLAPRSEMSERKFKFPHSTGLFCALLLVMLVFSVLSHGLFLYVDNLLGLLRYASSLAILGLGLTVVLIVGEIDLSFGSLYGFCTTAFAVAFLAWNWPMWLAFVFAFGLAVFWGAFNAFFTTIVKIPSFIATLGSSTFIFGFTLLIGNSNTFATAAPPVGSRTSEDSISFFRGLANQDLPAGLPVQAIWMVVVMVIFWVVLSRSIYGFRIKAIGGNKVAAELAKLPVKRYKFFAYILCAMAAATAGILDFSFIGTIQPNAGQTFLFPVFAAVVIGGASLQGGIGNVTGTILGALILAVISNGLSLLASGAFAQQIFLGTVTIGAVVIDVVLRRRRARA